MMYICICCVTRFRRLWDLLGLLLVIWDIFAIPMNAFEQLGTPSSWSVEAFLRFRWKLKASSGVDLGFTSKESDILALKSGRMRVGKVFDKLRF